MGLDAYFYRHTKVLESDIVSDEAILNAYNISDSLKLKLNHLNAYARSKDKYLFECLKDAISEYLNNHGEGYNDEILYFRKFHYLLDYFNYDDDWYANDMAVTREQCEDLRDRSKMCLEECVRMYEYNGCNMYEDYLNNDSLMQTRNYSAYTEPTELTSIITDICNKHFPNKWNDSYYDKVGHLYRGMCSILRETDWDRQEIIFNADW
jgi:hypothetical protein